MTVNSVNKTLYIPLYGKAYVSRKGLFLQDAKAEEIWDKEGFPLKGKAKSKWLAYNMGMRSAVFDRWLEAALEKTPDAIVLQLGCGMDSRGSRMTQTGSLWVDVDFPAVIDERKRYYVETETYRMIGGDIREPEWLETVPKADTAILVMEGVSMYLQREDLLALLSRLRAHFGTLTVLMDCYTVFGAKATRYKNPINEVGVTQVYGVDDPGELEVEGLHFRQEHDLVPEELIQELPGWEQTVFRKLFAGKMAKGIYRLYEYGTE